MGRYLFPVRVVVTAEQCFASFRRAAPELSPAALILVVAQTCGIEAGGGAHVRNFNMGGAKAKIGGSRDWTFFSTRDPAGPKDPKIVLHHAPTIARQQALTDPRDATWSERMTCFRAFPSLDAATADHIAMMRSDFTKAWALLRADAVDPVAFAHALKANGYFAADADEYGRALRMWRDRYAPLMPTWKADA